MKLKITAALLACLMLLASLSACDKNKEDPDQTKSQIPLLTTTEQKDDPVDPSTSATETTVEPAQTTEPATTTAASTTAATTTAATTAATTTASTTAATTAAPEEKFTACNDTVYVIASALNIRTSPAMGNDNIYGQAKQGEALKRTGYNESWFRIVIDDKEYYISANALYTSPDDPNVEIEFSVRYETVYVTAESLYVRETPHSAGAVYGVITKGTELIRIGYHEQWSKVMYDGKMLYCGSKYLSTENPIVETTTAVG